MTGAIDQHPPVREQGLVGDLDWEGCHVAGCVSFTAGYGLEEGLETADEAHVMGGFKGRVVSGYF